MIEIKPALNKEKFAHSIEELVKEKNISYIEAVCMWCKENDVDEVIASKLVVGAIKEKIEAEARDLNFLEKGAKLPL